MSLTDTAAWISRVYMGDEAPPMVRVVDAYMSFGQTVVLNDLNMTVPTGKIYALLGPSGCGKTILLNCIAGLRPLDDGYIKLEITKRNAIGYMPQDIGLPPDFTVRETLEFYGRVYDINVADLNQRIVELASLLELPDMNVQIKQLSGGEQRRVSLSVTLLHVPKLLLLDEPTVGVDPVLSQKIWKYLVRAAGSGITVIITTHYVEEARMAHLWSAVSLVVSYHGTDSVMWKVGMIRDGELLVEESPTQLMTKQRVNTLENAFLQLSRQQQLDILERKQGSFLRRRRKSKQLEEIFEPGGKFKTNRFFAQFIKNYISMKRNLTMICLMLLLPLTLSFLQREAYASLPRLKIGLVSEELNEEGESLCQRIRDYFSTEDFNCTTAAPFTCLLVQSFRESIDTIIYNDDEEAKSAVLNNEVWGMLHIPSNFTNTLNQLVLYGVSFLGSEETDRLLDMVNIDAHLDSSNFVINQWLRKKLSDRYQFFIRKLAVSCGLPENYATAPVRIMEPIHGHIDPTLTESILPAFLGAWCFYLTLLFTSGAVMMEKSVGLVERNMVAGITYLERVVAHTVFQTAMIAVQKGIMLVIFYVLYDETLLGSKTLAVVLLFAIEAVGVAYGFFITELCSCERIITFNAVSSLNFIFLFSGLLWPVEGAHGVLKNVFWAVPISPAIDAYKTIALRGQGLENYIVAKGFISCVAWVAIFSLGTFVSYRVKRYRRIS